MSDNNMNCNNTNTESIRNDPTDDLENRWFNEQRAEPPEWMVKIWYKQNMIGLSS